MLSIDNSTFYKCSSLTEIDLPDTLTFIGDKAFSECSLLNMVICRAIQVPQLGYSCYNSISTDAILYVQAEAVEDYENSDWAQYFSQILPIGDAPDAGVNEIAADNDGYYKIYNLKGMAVKITKDTSELNSLPAGLYIINGKTAIIK